MRSSWPCRLWPQIVGKLIKYFILFLNTYSCRNVYRIFFNFWHDLKKMTFWRIFIRSPAAAPPCHPPPFRSILLLLQTTRGRPEGGRSPAGLWSAVRRSASQNTNRFLVPGCGEWEGGRFTVGPGLSLFLSGLLVLHWSGQVPETRKLYSTVTHHTRNTLHVPGSLYLHLVGLPLLIRNWGPTLPQMVCDVPRGSQFI